ncbi:MAG: exo-alpha-sialidase [Clostridia bacterium]|nr:exo-alpha-sialidase [Clostridia bacterium]
MLFGHKKANKTVLPNGVEINVERVTTVLEASKTKVNNTLGYPTKVKTAHYPSVIELQHSGEKNGTLLATFCLGEQPLSGVSKTSGCVIESTDGGKTWKQIARPAETIDPSIRGISMAHLYELPAQVGDMPAGTLLYSGNSVNYNRKSHIAAWRSFDHGYTWEEYVIIAEGGGTREGVWEPVMWYEPSDGYLYCFYSDDSDPEHDQKLVYKRSKDGVNWSDAVDICAFSDYKARPGMFVMTKLGKALYFMVYELYGIENGYVYYKITNDVSSWIPSTAGTKLQTEEADYLLGGAPSCVWTSVGGKKGTLIVSGKLVMEGGVIPELFISFDYGQSWSIIENFLPYDPTNDTNKTNRIGHRPSFFVSSDPSVIYMMNNTDVPETGLQRLQVARIKIYD